MAADTEHELIAELRSLGRLVAPPVPGDDLEVAVMSRLAEAPVRRPSAAVPLRIERGTRWLAGRRRRTVALVAAILAALLVTPPVRAAVSDWFSFAGVIVRDDPSPAPTVSQPPPAVPTVTTSLTLQQAEALVAFPPSLPSDLGPPQGVEVSTDRRVLSVSWSSGRDGPVRMDQFDGRLDYAYMKAARQVEFIEIDGTPALWFEQPHEVSILNADGTTRRETARLAGHTLIWEAGGTTLRLEGEFSRARAEEIARSTEPVR